MILYEITFINGLSIRERIEDFLGALTGLGRLDDYTAMVECDGQNLKLFADSFTPFIWEEALVDAHIQRYDAELKAANCSMEIRYVAGKEELTHPLTPQSALVLYYQPYHRETPLWNLADFSVVPLHFIPRTYQDTEYYDIWCWWGDYKATYRLWNEVLYAQRTLRDQLFLPDSHLNADGRKLCAHIEQLSGIPTYYYVYRAYDRRSLRQELAYQLGVDHKDQSEIVHDNANYQFINHKERLVSNIVPDQFFAFQNLKI